MRLAFHLSGPRSSRGPSSHQPGSFPAVLLSDPLLPSPTLTTSYLGAFFCFSVSSHLNIGPTRELGLWSPCSPHPDGTRCAVGAQETWLGWVCVGGVSSAHKPHTCWLVSKAAALIVLGRPGWPNAGAGYMDTGFRQAAESPDAQGVGCIRFSQAGRGGGKLPATRQPALETPCPSWGGE